MDYTEVSRYISLILRHKPEVVGLKLDEHGWVNVDQLIEGVSRKCRDRQQTAILI